jgi:hypothetical protein
LDAAARRAVAAAAATLPRASDATREATRASPLPRETFELVRKHAESTNRLIRNQEAVIAELRAELRAVLETESLGDDAGGLIPAAAPRSASWNPSISATASLEVRSPGPPRVAPDWAAAYAEIDETRSTLAAARAAPPAPSRLDSEGTAPSPKTDWEAAYRDIEATRARAAAARAGGTSEPPGLEVSHVSAETVEEKRPLGGGGGERGSPDERLAKDLMEKLAAIGSEGADALLAQSPVARKTSKETPKGESASRRKKERLSVVSTVDSI